ncbi:MAG: helix-turn-helix domain-containing protein [Chloroflexota bacterium]|nr:helix-turn-helix domain-containing protein [Chloroflexota bacterium]
MGSFSELLSIFADRAGISDAELARRLGISRQTIFRWREGETQRPRHIEDVVRLADALRLEPEERDQLFVAAGFPPDRGINGVIGPEEDFEPRVGREQSRSPGAGNEKGWFRKVLDGRKAKWITVVSAGLILAIVTLGVSGVWSESTGLFDLTRRYDSEVSDTLVVVSEFANYGGGQVGYNIASRLEEALYKEFENADIGKVSVKKISEIVTEEVRAIEIGRELGADIVVWGEYDSGRVIAFVTSPSSDDRVGSLERRWNFVSAEELNATVNTDLPNEVQWIALYVLGQVHYWSGHEEQAEAVFLRTLEDLPEYPGNAATVYQFLAMIESRKETPDVDKVIAYYTEAIVLRPNLVQALNNRGIAYLERSADGDLSRAKNDFREAARVDPSFAVAIYHLALTLLMQDPDKSGETLDMLEKAEELDPEAVYIQDALCRYYSLVENPQEAIAHCDTAVASDPSGRRRGNRGITLALLGRTEEAIEDLEIFLEYLIENDADGFAKLAPSHRAWIESLERGQNPFNKAVLTNLLSE